MKKTTLLFFFISSFAMAQVENPTLLDHLNNRKGKLFFKAELEYRITPYSKLTTQTDNYIGNVNRDFQNSGAALNYSFNYFVTKNLSLNFGQSFRYETILYKEDKPDFYSSEVSQKALLTDYHFSMDYYFPVFKKAEIFVRLGISMFNRGSEYSISEAYYDTNGQLLSWGTSQLDTKFQPFNYALGYKKDKLDLIIGIYTTKETPYNNNLDRVLFPYAKIGYTLFKL